MKRRLMLAFLGVALIPLALLAFLNISATRAALTENAEEALLAAASEAGASIDAFINSNLEAVRIEAQLPELVEYLSLPADERAGGPEETRAVETLLALSLRDRANITSYALLDSQGVDVADTYAPDVSTDKSDRDYFRQALAVSGPYVSPVLFSPSTGDPSLYFSNPVRDTAGEVIGVLRVRYSADVVQQLLVQKNDLIGRDSFGVLFDELHIHLAHGTAPQALFTAITPLSEAEAERLRAAGRLPDLPTEQLFIDLPDLERDLSNVADQPVFTAEDVATGMRVNQVAVVSLETQPWLVAFFQPEDVFLAPVVSQTRTSLLLAGVIAVVVVAAAIGMGQLLADPLVHLTDAVTRFTAGDLDARADVRSKDETGLLAASFNTMAEQVGSLLTSLRETQERIQAQNRQLVEANHELAVARRKAEDATRLKSEFLATMSHELRTPLNAIIGYAQLLLAGMTGELNDEQRDYHERILLNGTNLLKLINDVLDLAKIEAGRTEIIRKPLKLREWVDEVVSQVRGLADEKGLRFEVMLDERMPAEIVGDPDRLRQIALNLLSNAVKFTDQGSVRLQIQKQGRDAWELVVSDTGIGIPSHAQEYIFDEFRQVDGTSERKHGGTGLGLSIVRNLALMMGGNVRVKSKLGQGSTFTVLLPLVTEGKTVALS